MLPSSSTFTVTCGGVVSTGPSPLPIKPGLPVKSSYEPAGTSTLTAPSVPGGTCAV